MDATGYDRIRHPEDKGSVIKEIDMPKIFLISSFIIMAAIVLIATGTGFVGFVLFVLLAIGVYALVADRGISDF